MNQQLLLATSKASHLARTVTMPLGFDIHLVVIDESRYYRDDVLKLAGKVFQVYAYDANRVTHCCEITPSYELHPVATQALNCPESEADRETIDEMLCSAQHDAIYMQCRAVAGMSDKFRRAYHVIESQEDETYESQLESVLERIRCNPPCVAPGRTGCILI